MMRATAALALLLVRHWARAALPNRLRRDKGRRISAGIFRLAYLGMIGGWGYAVGHLLQRLEPEQRLRGGAWLIVGMLGLSVTWSALTRGPTFRGEPSPLESSFLDTLPVREDSRLAVGMLERLFVYAFAASALIGVAPRAPFRAVILALALSTAGVFAGEALMRVARIVVAPMMIARGRSYLLALSQMLFLLCIIQAPALAKSERLGVVVAGAPSVIVRAIVAGEGFAFVLGLTGLVVAFELGAIAIAERVGYDRVDLAPTASPKRSKTEMLVLRRIDDLLRSREPGGRWSALVMMANTVLITGMSVAFAWSSKGAAPRGEMPELMTKSACYVAIFGAFVVASTRASRMATRDVAARALLSPLPIEPRELLEGRAGRLRRSALLVAFPLLALLATPWSVEHHVTTAWRVGAVFIAVALSAKAATSIAFLTVGAGSKKIGGSFAVESVLVLVPLAGVVTAPYAWSVVVPLTALALVSREANKSALGCVRWLDDSDEFERETPIWRALLVLGTFHSAQTLAGRAAELSELDAGTKTAIAYGASSVVLVLLTIHARREAPPMRVVPQRLLWLPLGAVLGLASGMLGVLWVRLLERVGVELPAAAAGTSKLAILITTVLLAPIAEETFFRGWLFESIEHELEPKRRSWLLPLISAFAFAAVHPPLAFVPVFVLGLVTSAVFARTRALGPSIFAHLCHNAVVLVLATAI